jgi:hypothetical protein
MPRYRGNTSHMANRQVPKFITELTVTAGATAKIDWTKEPRILNVLSFLGSA